VSQALKALRDRGWIETRRRSITVLDMEALKRRAT
jgi:DNA-binding FadR family transcriptional regulator